MTGNVPATFEPNAVAKLQGLPFALDGGYNSEATGSTQPFISLFNGLRNGGIAVIPAVSTNDDQAYVSAALQLVAATEGRAVVIVRLSDIPTVVQWCSSNGVNKSNTDLVVTVGDVSNYDPISFAHYVIHTIRSMLPQLSGWLSISLHSYSAARDHGGYNRGRNLVPRKCWQLWSNVAQAQLTFQLDYSDCGHIHASLDEVPGYAMASATVSVRYTINDYWVVLKGAPTRGPSGISMRNQYQSHAVSLMQEQEFNQIPGCWGDARIQHYATTTGNTGGRRQWVEISLNRHISHVCERLP